MSSFAERLYSVRISELIETFEQANALTAASLASDERQRRTAIEFAVAEGRVLRSWIVT